MSFFKLCTDDAIVNTLQSVFNANIVRIPEARIRPLSAIAVSSGKPTFWGYLNELTESEIQGTQEAIDESQMADISGKRSKSVNADIGLQILEGFLSGFSLPAAAIATKFSGAKTVSFSFQQVVRYFISPGQLGKLLKGHALDAGNASNTLFLNGKARLLVIDSVITSKDFSINVDKTNANDFSLDVPAIEKIIGQANTSVKIESSSNLAITFRGNTPLSFAFTCLQCELDEAGRISLQPFSGNVTYTKGPNIEHELLFDEPGMIEWES